MKKIIDCQLIESSINAALPRFDSLRGYYRNDEAAGWMYPDKCFEAAFADIDPNTGNVIAITIYVHSDELEAARHKRNTDTVDITEQIDDAICGCRMGLFDSNEFREAIIREIKEAITNRNND